MKRRCCVLKRSLPPSLRLWRTRTASFRGVRFCGVDRGDQGDPDFPAEIFQTGIFGFVDDTCFDQEQQPVTRFVRLLQGNLQVGNEIRFALGILRFVDVRSDAGSRSADLIANDRLVPAFEILDQIQYFNP